MSGMDQLHSVQMVQGINGTNPAKPVGAVREDSTSFKEQLVRLHERQLESLSFSKHAAKRLDERNIEVNKGFMDDLEHAVDEARKKGAKDVAVISRQGIFIVNVPHNIVVTTMTEDDMKNKTLTNIDSAVFL